MSKVDDLMFEGGTLFHNSESDDVQYYRQHENPIEAITPPPPLVLIGVSGQLTTVNSSNTITEIPKFKMYDPTDKPTNQQEPKPEHEPLTNRQPTRTNQQKSTSHFQTRTNQQEQTRRTQTTDKPTNQ